MDGLGLSETDGAPQFVRPEVIEDLGWSETGIISSIKACQSGVIGLLVEFRHVSSRAHLMILPCWNHRRIHSQY